VQLHAQPALVAGLAGLGAARHAIARARERHVPAPASTAPGHHGARPLAHEVGQQPLVVEDDGAVGHRDDEVLAGGAVPLGLLPPHPVARRLVGVIGEP